MNLTARRSATKRSHRARYAAIGVGVVAVALVAVLATRSVTPGTTASSTLFGHQAPAISGRSIVSGGALELHALRGRFVVVVFFASWCVPCTDEIPQLESFLFSHRQTNNVAVLGVDIDDSAPDGAAFLRRTGATFPALEDGSGLIAQRYGVDSPPQAFLVSPSGVVVARVLSGVTAVELDRLIADERI